MSWSGEGATLRSPLEQVWRQFVPQGHDAALRNAFYNVAAAGFVAVAGAAAWHVYLIFQPFVRALLWAVLCGSAIHPAKTAVVDAVQSWLGGISQSQSSLTLSLLVLPLQTLDTVSEMVGSYVVHHARTVVIVTVVLPVVFIIIHYTPTVFTTVVCWILATSFNAVAFVMSTATSNKYVVVALVCAYVTSLFVYWEQEAYRLWMSRLSVAVWLLAGAGVAGWLFPSSITQPVFGVFCLLLLLGLVVEVLEYMNDEEQDFADSSSLVRSVVKVCKDEYDSPAKQRAAPSCKTDPFAVPVLESVMEEEASATAPLAGGGGRAATGVDDIDLPQEKGINSTDDGESASRPQKFLTPDDEHPGSGVPCTGSHAPPDTPSTSHTSGDTEQSAAGGRDTKGLNAHSCSTDTDEEENVSNTYIKGVLMACVLVELWRHHYLLVLLPVALVYLTIKKTTSVCLSGGSLGEAASSWCGGLWAAVCQWTASRRDALLPPPLRGVLKLVHRSEACVVQLVSGSLDALVTCCLILAALVFIISAAIFLAVQIQGESMQLVGVASQIFNATVVSNPQFIALLPDDIGDTMSSALDNAYHYGRDWIIKWVRGVVGDADEAKALALEKQVLELWDRVYQAWVIAPARTTGPLTGPVVTSQAVADTFDNLMQGIANSPGLVSLESLSEIVSANVGTILSVAESVWALLLSNISLVLSLATTSASALLGGSLSLLNAVISAVVFLTALFYVLSSSGHAYKPVAMLGNLAPGHMNSVGVALEQAINGVFTASLKMGLFYGLWTWLLHSIFGTNIVYVPAVLGALFGAVPLVGTYWACIPGLLELWWGHKSPSLALLLLLFQLAPLSCVDTAIYAEIKGGGHPYLTGLAVGGGIFCWGAEGAILGPLLLCILLVATNLYAALISPPPPQPTQGNRFSRLRRNLTLVE